MISGIKDYVDAIDGGQTVLSSFRKVPAIGTTAGVWADLSMAPGNPKPNYYTGAELSFTTLNANNGIYHGQNISPLKKHLKQIMLLSTSATAVNNAFYLMDYIGFYPLVDMDSTDAQLFDNATPLPRYIDGKGVQAFLVATNPYIGGASFSINYTNQNGTSGRTSVSTVSNTAGGIGTLITGGSSIPSGFSPFIPLQSGDYGIRSVQSITFTASNGGLAALVLCKPLAQTIIREVNAPCEFESIKDKSPLPIIEDGAYLNMICLPSGNLASAPILGIIESIWG